MASTTYDCSKCDICQAYKYINNATKALNCCQPNIAIECLKESIDYFEFINMLNFEDFNK